MMFPEKFRNDFALLTGYLPYPWQAALFKHLLNGSIPPMIGVPTGLGKTSVVAIWLLARMARPSLPTRLVYAVNRRTVVDQTTAEVERLRERLNHPELAELHSQLGLPDSGLPISTLRGQFNDNRRWQEDPSRPCVVVGTVDMIGSRLLFNGYRTGRWQRARHAGLLGQDSLVVHDEAHLEPVFQGLLEWIEDRQARDGSPRPLKVLAMTATGTSRQGENEPVFTSADEEDRRVRQRYRDVQKMVTLHPLDGKAKPSDRILELAWAHEGGHCRVIVFVRSPEDAQKITDGLRKKICTSKKGDPSQRVALLTGTIRGYERDRLVLHPAVASLLDPDLPPPAQTTWLVSTSAGEVGADFDADHGVCDLTTFDAMVQRFGRINRRGGSGRTARIDLVLDLPQTKDDKKTTPLDRARRKTAALLNELPKDKEVPASRVASPAVLRAFMSAHAEACTEASAPPPGSRLPHPAVLDAWTLTSIQAQWSLSHEVEPYLHGDEKGAPETLIAWRSLLDMLQEQANGMDLGGASRLLESALEYHPLRPMELLREPSWTLTRRLQDLAKAHPGAWIGLLGRTTEVVPLAELVRDERSLSARLANRTLVLPPSLGGLDDAGLFDGQTPAREMLNLSEHSLSQKGALWRDRAAKVVRRTEEGWRFKDPEDPPGGFPTWMKARDTCSKQTGMDFLGQLVLCEGEDGVLERLLFFQKNESAQRLEAEKEVRLSDHLRAAGQMVESLSGRLNLAPLEAMALRLAAEGHDRGKRDPRWQRAIGLDHPTVPLAKSYGKGFNPKALGGYRHEYGSLSDMAAAGKDVAALDLALHLVASHHGRARPQFEADTLDSKALETPLGIAMRFARLQKRYGPWGLAWLEAILMAADAESSAHPTVWNSDDPKEGEA